jgi:tRNA 2-thiouridine synthesizing protein B
MTLHTWNKADSRHVLLDSCLSSLAAGDTLLLLEDGVYLLAQEDFLQKFAPYAAAGVQLALLVPDLAARGVSARIPAAASVIGYKEFVALALHHDRVVNWN